MLKKIFYSLAFLLLLNINDIHSNEVSNSDFAIVGYIRSSLTDSKELVESNVSLAKLSYSKNTDCYNVDFLIRAENLLLPLENKRFLIRSVLPEDNIYNNEMAQIILPVSDSDSHIAKLEKYSKIYQAGFKKKEQKLRNKVINNNFKAVKNYISILLSKNKSLNISGILSCDDNVIYEIDINKKLEYDKDQFFICYAPKIWSKDKMLEAIKTKEKDINNKQTFEKVYRYNFKKVEKKEKKQDNIKLGIDDKVAIKLAEIFLGKIYGGKIIEQRPWVVLNYKDRIKVEGSINKKEFGGGAEIIIRKSDGKVMSYNSNK